MYQIVKDGVALALTEAPTYVRLLENGCFALCTADAAQGIAHDGRVYHLLDRPELEGLETVILEEVDSGAAIGEAKSMAGATAALTGQVAVAAQVYARAATDIPGAAALQMKSLFQTWEEVLEAGKHLPGGVIINDGGILYRVVGANGVDPLPHQPPHGEGMLAVYRPIDTEHAGTPEDPIPWVYGMDCTAGLYYSSGAAVYLCRADMRPCVWAPGTPGVYQWEVAE